MSPHDDHEGQDHARPPLSAHMGAYQATSRDDHDDEHGSHGHGGHGHGGDGHGVSADADARYLLIALGLIVGS